MRWDKDKYQITAPLDNRKHRNVGVVRSAPGTKDYRYRKSGFAIIVLAGCDANAVPEGVHNSDCILQNMALGVQVDNHQRIRQKDSF